MHADHGAQFTSWVFGERIRSAGLLPSFGTVGDGLENAMTESFWSSMQIELLNRKRWKTRVELANAIFEYIEVFHNRQRRHSALGYRTPIEYEPLSEQEPSSPPVSHCGWNPNRGARQDVTRSCGGYLAGSGFPSDLNMKHGPAIEEP